MAKKKLTKVERAAIEAELETLQKEQLKEMERFSSYRENNLCNFFKPFKWQKRLLEGVRKKNITVVTSSNKIGKTGTGANIVISWALGYEPWNEVDKDFKDAVKVNDVYYAPSSLGMKPPVRIVITGEDWKTHIGITLIPELKKWAPKGEYTTKRNEQGVENSWKWKNGSEFMIMCYTQRDELFESFRCNAAWFDEPPPKKKFDGISRGLLLDRGKKLLTMTPLNEPWVLDDLVLSGRNDVFVLDQLLITENEKLYADDYSILREADLSDKQIDTFFEKLLYKDKEKDLPVIDKGRQSETYLQDIGVPDDEIVKLRLLGFIKDVDPSEVLPRIFGVFKSLVGKIIKQFDMGVHWIEPFKIPTDWPVIAMIDFHLNKEQAISFHTVDHHDVKYITKEVWDHLGPEEIADAIIRYKETNNLNLKEAYIDALSKGDTQFMSNRMGTDLEDSFSIIERRLASHGITLMVASKDKDSGIRNIWKGLEGVSGRPTYYIVNTCKQHLFEINRWVYDEDGKPAKENDHFMENWYRVTHVLKYKEPIKTTRNRPRQRSGSGSWMG